MVVQIRRSAAQYWDHWKLNYPIVFRDAWSSVYKMLLSFHAKQRNLASA